MMGINLLTEEQRLKRNQIPSLVTQFKKLYQSYTSNGQKFNEINWARLQVLLDRLPQRINQQIDNSRLSIRRSDQTEIILHNNRVSCLNLSHTQLGRLITVLSDPPEPKLAAIQVFQELSLLSQIISETLEELLDAYSYLDYAFEIAISDFNNDHEVLDNLALLYEWSYVGILDTGIEPIIFIDLCNRSMQLREKIGNYQKMSSNLLTLAELFFIMDNLPAAIYHYQRLITLPNYGDLFSASTKIHHRMMYIYTLSFTDQVDRAQELLEEIDQIIDSIPDIDEPFFTSQNIKHKRLLSEALILKMSSRFRDKYKAEAMLTELLADEFLSSDIRQIASKTLIKLLLTEFEYTGELVVLEEIQQLIEHLPDSQHSIFHARLLFLTGNMDEAVTLLEEKREDANRVGNLTLAREIQEEITHIQNTMMKWANNIETNITFSQKVRDLNFTNYVKFAKNFESHLMTLNIEQNEQPIIFMIIGLGGNLRYHLTFAIPGTVNEHLLSSFLVAINQFGSEALSGNIDRIYQGEFTISIKNVESLNFCYVYKGFSADYDERIEQIITEIRMDHKFWNTLEDTNYLLVSDFKERLDQIILEKFERNIRDE